MASETATAPPTLVQYVILRKDLTKKPFSWPAGSQIAQACHVVSKTLWELKEEPNVQAYMADIDNMHKVTLAAQDEGELKGVMLALSEKGLHFRRYDSSWVCLLHDGLVDRRPGAWLPSFSRTNLRSWIEQPEGTLTAVATMPYPRDVISPCLKHLPLYR